jgi:hypothetical protein
MTLYNTSLVENTPGVTHFFLGVNTLSGGLLGVFLLIFIFVIGFMGGKQIGNDAEKSLINSFGVTSVFAALFFFLGLILWQVAIIPLICYIGLVMFRQFGDG